MGNIFGSGQKKEIESDLQVLTSPLGKKYVIYRPSISAGVMGKVHKAFDCETGQTVAIKESISQPKALEEELDFLKAVQEKCAEYTVCVQEQFYIDKTAYLVMEFINGGVNLEKYINDIVPLETGRKQGLLQFVGRVYRNDAALQLVKGVDLIHKLGVAHQDIKESNIMWDFVSDTPRIVDFGSIYINAERRKALDKLDLPVLPGFKGTNYTAPVEFRDLIGRFNAKRAAFQKDPSKPKPDLADRSLVSEYMRCLWDSNSTDEAAWKTAKAHDIWSLGIVLYHWYCVDKVVERDYFNQLEYSAMLDEIDVKLPLVNLWAHDLLRLLLEEDPLKRLSNWPRIMTMVLTDKPLNYKGIIDGIDYSIDYNKLRTEKLVDELVQTAKDKCVVLGYDNQVAQMIGGDSVYLMKQYLLTDKRRLNLLAKKHNLPKNLDQNDLAWLVAIEEKI